jgi:hypothetical protein
MKKRDSAVRCGAFFAAILLVAVVAGCSARDTAVSSGGGLEVFPPFPDLSADDSWKGWIVRGSSRQISIVQADGFNALRMENSAEDLLLAAPTDALLMAAPYLDWFWNVQHHGARTHPVRIVVGFRSAGSKSDEARKASFSRNGPLPPHDRTLVFAWGKSALQRGTLTSPAAGGGTAPRYTVRGGRENTRKWWREAVDLSRLHARAWPESPLVGTRVVFIGVVATGNASVAAANFAGMTLRR